MTKKEIVRQISERADLPQLKTKEIVQWTFDAIIQTLVREGRIELRNFGVFEVKQRKARKARNPLTDEPVTVGPKNVVTFQPGKQMEQEVLAMDLAAVLAKRPKKKRKKPKVTAQRKTANKPSSDSPPVNLSGEPGYNGTPGTDHAEPTPKPKSKRRKKAAPAE